VRTLFSRARVTGVLIFSFKEWEVKVKVKVKVGGQGQRNLTKMLRMSRTVMGRQREWTASHLCRQCRRHFRLLVHLLYTARPVSMTWHQLDIHHYSFPPPVIQACTPNHYGTVVWNRSIRHSIIISTLKCASSWSGISPKIDLVQPSPGPLKPGWFWRA